MKYLDLTLPTPPENLACDEALAEWEAADGGQEVLRFWAPTDYFVVLGYANRAEREVNLPACRERGLPVYRRISGGGTVLQGPGCLNYTLILDVAAHAPLSSIPDTNTFIMQRHRQALAPLLPSRAVSLPMAATEPERRKRGCSPRIHVRGCTDLALGDRKFSGNAQRRLQHRVLFHGTVLLNFDLALMEPVLRRPDRQPAYRQNRAHSAFVTNLHLPPALVKEALKSAWQAQAPLDRIPTEDIARLVREKYGQPEWNLKF